MAFCSSGKKIVLKLRFFLLVFSRTLLQFAKKKRKRSDSGSDVDLDVTPPPSPAGDENPIEKRRSGRNTKRKKYVDDVDLNLSDEENILMQLPPDVVNNAAPKDGAKSATGGATPVSAACDPEASNASSTVPGTPAEGDGTSGPNYAFVVCFVFMYP